MASVLWNIKDPRQGVWCVLYSFRGYGILFCGTVELPEGVLKHTRPEFGLVRAVYFMLAPGLRWPLWVSAECLEGSAVGPHCGSPNPALPSPAQPWIPRSQTCSSSSLAESQSVQT